jgi:hypothetical protein|tara:strand:+ start:313 stop:552 length:240 start_codon:yes stop_codon:yes gene_type:complete
MNPITYALITLICMIASFYFAKYFTVKSYFEDIVTNTLDRLESEGFILTKTDKDGEKELIPVSEAIVAAVNEIKKEVKK